MSLGDYFRALLPLIIQGLVGKGGAIWLRTDQGHIQLQVQINGSQIGLDEVGPHQKNHEEILRAAFQNEKPLCLSPMGYCSPELSESLPSNPTQLMLLLAPVRIDKQVAGLIEIGTSSPPLPSQAKVIRTLAKLGNRASIFLCNLQRRQFIGQQFLWKRLDDFSHRIHSS